MIKICISVAIICIFAITNSESQELLRDPCFTPLNHPSEGFKLSDTSYKGNCTDFKWHITPDTSKANKTATISLLMSVLFLHDDDEVFIFKSLNDSMNNNLTIVPPIHSQNGSLTFVTEEKELVIKLVLKVKGFTRKFDGSYSGLGCTFAVTPETTILHSPINLANTSSYECIYNFNKQGVKRIEQAFTFEQFNFTSSTVELAHSTKDGPYSHNPPIDFFPMAGSAPLQMTVKMINGTSEHFCLKITDVDSACSGQIELHNAAEKAILDSPKQFINGSDAYECRRIIKYTDTKQILGFDLGKVHFESPLDIIAVNDGGSVLSRPLFQVTASNINATKKQVIRSSSSYLWISFKPISYESSFTANVTVHGQGGYLKHSGAFTMNPTDGNDTVFLLEVEAHQNVMVNFETSSLPPSAAIAVYEDFEQTNLLTVLRGQIWYPVVSRTSKMLLVATGFNKASFTASFKGISPGCVHMSTMSDENYVISGNCKTTCTWVLPPQNVQNSVLLLNIQLVSMEKGDFIEIFKLDSPKTRIGEVNANASHVPQMVIPAEIGALVSITRGNCTEQSTPFVGHSSYIPSCGKDMALKSTDTFQLQSPLYPDTYPLYGNCHWKLATTKDNIIHLAFNSMNLSPNHCVRIVEMSTKKSYNFSGSDLPEDVFLVSDSVVEFDATSCKQSSGLAAMVSAGGFVLNGTTSGCGKVMVGKASGEFTFPANTTLCMLKVNVPLTGDDAKDVVNIISYTVSEKDGAGNYDLQAFDGNSVRDPLISNHSKSDIWSRTNDLILIYRRKDNSKPSASLTIKYTTVGCNETMQCDNKRCLHPDWRCNGVNDCGDFTDEKNCATVPIPDIHPPDGYSPATFWAVAILMLVFGVGIGFGGPVVVQKMRDARRYSRFDDVSVIG